MFLFLVFALPYMKGAVRAKLKITELTYWHIYRDGSPRNSGLLGHEYNFAGIFGIIPKAEDVIAAFYLELPMAKGVTLKVNTASIPSELGTQVVTGKSIVKICFFQTILPTEMAVPMYGHVEVRFNRGVKARSKVDIRPDDASSFLASHIAIARTKARQEARPRTH